VPFYSLLRPFAFALDAETAHRATIAALQFAHRLPPRRFAASLRSTVAGIDFPSPVGLAAGFDKDAQVPEAMLGAGFGFVEVGTVTPRPQPGNPMPRLFRLARDEAVIKELQDFVKRMIAPYKYPRAIAFLEALPRTETGKLQRFKLRALP